MSTATSASRILKTVERKTVRRRRSIVHGYCRTKRHHRGCRRRRRARDRVGPVDEGDGLYGQIMALAVAPDHRRSGVGHLLVQSAESLLRARGVSGVVVTFRQSASRCARVLRKEWLRLDGSPVQKDGGAVRLAPWSRLRPLDEGMEPVAIRERLRRETAELPTLGNHV